MQSKNEKVFVRKTFSQKNGCHVAYQAENQKVFEFLERSDDIKSYACSIPLDEADRVLDGYSFDKEILREAYISDFCIFYVNGDEKILDVLHQKDSRSKKMMELLDIARCYWQLKGKNWGVVTVGL